MISIGNAFALLARNTPVVAAFGKVAALLAGVQSSSSPIRISVGTRHVALEPEAGRVEARPLRGIFLRRCVRPDHAPPRAAPAWPPCENPTTATRPGSTDGLPVEESSGRDRRHARSMGGSPLVQAFVMPRGTEAVDGQRDVAPVREPLAPALVESAASRRRSRAAARPRARGRGHRAAAGKPCSACGPASGLSISTKTWRRLGCQCEAHASASGQERGEDGGNFGEVRHGPPRKRSTDDDLL